MTASLSGKKSGLIVGGIVVLALAAYGGMRYVESQVVDNVRASIANVPADWKLTVGDVRFSLLNKTLVLRDIAGAPTRNGITFDGTIGELTLVDPNPDLTDPANKTKDNVPLAKSVTVRSVKINVPQGKFQGSIEELRLTNLAMDLKRYFTLMETYKVPSFSAGGQAVILDEYSADKMSLAMTEDVPLSMTVTKLVQQKLDRGSMAGGTVEGITVFMEGQPKVTLEKVVSGRVNAPDDQTLAEFERFSQTAETGTPPSDEEALRVLGLLFGSPKPAIESFSMVNLATTTPEFPMSMKSLDYTNPTNHPYTASLGVTNLVLPVAFVPGLEQLSMLGYKTLDFSAAFGLKWPKQDVLQATVNMSIKDMADFTSTMDTAVKPDIFSTSAMDDFEAALMKNPPKLALLEMTLDDKGLIGRSAATAHMTSGLTPEASTTLLKTLLSAVFVDYMTPEKAQERLGVLMSFVNKPGKLTLKVAPKEPLAIDTLTGNEDFIIIEAVPGPKTLNELVAGQK